MSSQLSLKNGSRASQFRADPVVERAIESIIERLALHQQGLEAKRADEQSVESYASELAVFGDQRGGAPFFPYLGSGFGRGPLVELKDGRVVYDMITGIGAMPAGHSDPRIVQAQLRAALNDVVIQGNLQQNGDSAVFTQTLIRAASANGADLKHCFLSNTGVMAGENALKIAFQKNAPAHRVLAFEGCFAGRTHAFSQITDKPAFREGLPESLSVDYVPFYEVEDPVGSTERALAVLEQHLKRYPKVHACMFFELIQGEGGFKLGSRAFFEALMTRCRKAGVAVLIDEVQTFARTEELFAFQYFGLDELVDVVWIGKASQACAMLYTPAFKPRPGLLSQTFTASTSAIAAGQVIVDTLLNEGYYGPDGKLARMHASFVEKITIMSAKNGHRLHGPHGIGGMWAFTLDEGAAVPTREFVQHLFEAGVLSLMAGSAPARIRFLPPFLALTEDDIVEVALRIEKALRTFPPNG